MRYSDRKIAKYAFWIQKLTEDAHTDFSEQDYSAVNNQKTIWRSAHIPEFKQLQRLIAPRKTTRDMRGARTSKSICEQILALSYGSSNENHRVVPSAGGFYALTLWLCRINSGKIQEVYRFDPQSGEVEFCHLVDDDLQNGFRVYQVKYASASWMIVWNCKLLPAAAKYGARAYRFLCIEIGHSAQMAVLACCSLNIEHATLGGLIESHIRNHWLKVGQKQLPQYALLFR